MYFSSPLTLKAVDDGRIAGYALTFNAKDREGCLFLPGCCERSIAQHDAFGTAPALLDNHDSLAPIGAWHSLQEDAQGLAVVGQLATNLPRAKQLFEVARLGKSLFLSAGFRSIDPFDARPGERVAFKEIDILEISLTTVPSVRGTAVSVRSLRDHTSTRDLEGHLRDLGLSRRESVRAASALWPILRGESAQSDELAALKTALANRTHLFR